MNKLEQLNQKIKQVEHVLSGMSKPVLQADSKKMLSSISRLGKGQTNMLVITMLIDLLETMHKALLKPNKENMARFTANLRLMDKADRYGGYRPPHADAVIYSKTTNPTMHRETHVTDSPKEPTRKDTSI